MEKGFRHEHRKEKKRKRDENVKVSQSQANFKANLLALFENEPSLSSHKSKSGFSIDKTFSGCAAS